MFITDDDNNQRPWTPEQAWFLIRSLANSENGSILYSQATFSDLFKKDGDRTIQSLEQAELVSVIRINGRPSTIKPGKPVYTAAFRRLVDDDVLRCRLELRTLGQQIAAESANINKFEQELQVLSSLDKEPKEIKARVRWLLGNLVGSQGKIEKYEQQMGDLKKVLQSHE